MPVLLQESSALPVLLHAARRGDTKTVAQLLTESPKNVDEVDERGQTALHYAAQGGHVEVINQLLAHKPALIDIFATLNGWIPLHVAAVAGHGEVVALLLAHKPELIDVKDWFYGKNALHYAAIGGHEHIVEQLFALRPSLIDATTLDLGMTALHLAAVNDHDGVVAKLLALGPSLCAMKNKDGEMALHLAAHRGDDKTVENLLAHSPHLSDCSCNTPLHYAASGGHAKVVARLLAYDPTLIDARDYYGNNALHIAAWDGQHEVLAVLLAHSPELIDSQNSFGKGTALHLATGLSLYQGNYLRVMSQLIAIRPSLVHEVDGEGRPALFLGALRGDAIVEFLLPLAPEQVFLTDFHDDTLLHCCLTCRGFAACSKLIEKVWRMNPEALFMANAKGLTPFDLAARYHNRAFELFQWKFPMDDILAVQTCPKKALQRLRPLVVGECNGPLLECLHQDLVDTVYEYLGFERCTRKRKIQEEEGR